LKLRPKSRKGAIEIAILAVAIILLILAAFIAWLAYSGRLVLVEPTSSTSSDSVGVIYKIVYSGTAQGTDSNNPEPQVPNEQCSADFPCSSFVQDGATWTWSYTFYYADFPSGGELSSYVPVESDETMQYAAQWTAIPSIYDTAYSCTKSSSVISNPQYAPENSTGVLLALTSHASGLTVSSTAYDPWHAILFDTGCNYQGQEVISNTDCASGYSDIWSFPLIPGTYNAMNSTTCPSSDDNGTIGGYAGGSLSYKGSITVTEWSCTSIRAAVEAEVPLLQSACPGADDTAT